LGDCRLVKVAGHGFELRTPSLSQAVVVINVRMGKIIRAAKWSNGSRKRTKL